MQRTGVPLYGGRLSIMARGGRTGSGRIFADLAAKSPHFSGAF